MDRHESKEDYLETIYKLHLENELVRSIDIANEMNYSKASVSIAMKKLKNKFLIIVDDETGNIVLTDEGEKIAKNIYEHHNIICAVLINLGVRENVARIDACKIEHDLSEESYQAIKKHVTEFLK